MKRKTKVVLIVVLGCVVVLLAFIVYVSQRGGPDYTEELARLLPADTPAYVSLRNLNALWTCIEAMQFARGLGASGALSRLLVSSKDWQSLQKKKQRFEQRTTVRLGEKFIKKWFGRHVVLALIEVPDTELPGLLLLSKTELGFEEKLAELVAQLYPGLKLRTEHYRNSLINVYDAEKAGHGFAYVRFGRTVVLSLRSNTSAYLKRVIDLKMADSTVTLADSTTFQKAFAGMEKAEGLVCYIIPQPFIRILSALPSVTIHKHLSKQAMASLSPMLEGYEYWRAAFSVHRGFVGDFKFHYKTASQTPPERLPGSIPSSKSALSFLPVNTLGLLKVQGPDLRGSLTELVACLALSPSKEADEQLKAIEDATGINPVRDLFPYLDNELTLALCDIQPGLLFPQFTAELFIKSSDVHAVRQITTQRAHEIHLGGQSFPLEETRIDNHTIYSCQTPFGPVGYTFLEPYLLVMVGTQILEKNLAVHSADQRNVTENSIYRQVRANALENPSCLLYVNFEETANALQRVADRSLQWQRKIRSKVQENYRRIDVLRHLKALCITTSTSPDSSDLRLYVPAQ
jgi:hypothetical protein